MTCVTWNKYLLEKGNFVKCWIRLEVGPQRRFWKYNTILPNAIAFFLLLLFISPGITLLNSCILRAASFEQVLTLGMVDEPNILRVVIPQLCFLEQLHMINETCFKAFKIIKTFPGQFFFLSGISQGIFNDNMETKENNRIKIIKISIRSLCCPQYIPT